eukprot:UN22179
MTNQKSDSGESRNELDPKRDEEGFLEKMVDIDEKLTKLNDFTVENVNTHVQILTQGMKNLVQGESDTSIICTDQISGSGRNIENS